jgi:hypothetical protein
LALTRAVGFDASQLDPFAHARSQDPSCLGAPETLKW